MWSRTTPPDKPTGTDAPPQTCPSAPPLMHCRPPLARQAHQPWACRRSPSSRLGARRESASRRRLETHRPAPNYATSGLAPDPAALPATTVREESASPPIWPGKRPAQRHHLHLRCVRLRGARDQIKRTSGTTGTIVTAGTILQCDGTELPIVLYSAYSP